MSSNPSIDYRILGKNIKDARERLDKTQGDVAHELDIIVTTYGKYERGTLKPNLERVIAICSVLSITLEDIFRGALIIQINPSNANEAEAPMQLPVMPPLGRGAVL